MLLRSFNLMMDIYDEQLGEQASIEKDIQQLTLTEICMFEI